MKKTCKIGTMIVLFSMISCASSFYRMNADSSIPINKKEESTYRLTASRCFRVGGTRIVKIDGKLQCF